MRTETLKFQVSDSIGQVSAEILEPGKMKCLMVLAHGAGAGMDHKFMRSLAEQLYLRGIGTFRFNFPFMENRKGRPDPPAIAEKTVLRAIGSAGDRYREVPLIAAGKSFGGRMSSQLLSKNADTPVKALVFYGFPLHAPGKSSITRADHLTSVGVPMLFLQGTRDALADVKLITQVTSDLKRATLRLVEGADHSFAAGKKDLIPGLAEVTDEWISALNSAN